VTLTDDNCSDDPAPGSPAAIARGCTCSAAINNDGLGRFDERRQRVIHFPKNDCPLHGLHTLIVDEDT
jgi:hypothetical protein